MAGRWSVLKLGDVCTKIGSGATPRGGGSVYRESGPYALVRSQNIHNYGFTYEGLAHIKQVHADQLSGVEVLEGDILLNITGESVARVCQGPWGLLAGRNSEHVAIVRPGPSRLGPGFLRSSVAGPETPPRLLAWASAGATRRALTKSMIESLEVPVPGVEDQRRIAHILGTLDDKIELNRRVNETLEEMARALFTSWFVDFDPVRAKAEGRDPGLPPHLADLVPDRLVDSESGEIPEGWEVRPLGDLLQVLETGGRPKGGVALYDSGVPSIGAESIVGLGIHDFSKTKYVPREYFDAMRRGHIQDGDVLLYKDGGKPGQFEPHVTLVGDGFPFSECAINEHVYRLRADSALGQAYLYFWLSSEAAETEMRNRGTGVAIPGLNSTQVKSLTTLVPTQLVAGYFGRTCGPLVSRILANCGESRALAAIRDALLPRLISGEISSSAIGRREVALASSGS